MAQIERPSLITEWPTFATLLGCYGGWIALLFRAALAVCAGLGGDDRSAIFAAT